jgi:hypothetical protein
VRTSWARATTTLALCAALCGCGVSGGGDATLGYPTATPLVAHRTLTPTWEHLRWQLTPPRGWGVARLIQGKDDLSLVHLTGACYLSISVTGSAIERLSAPALAKLYAKPANGYGWTVSSFGGARVAVLSQSATSSRPASRSTLAAAYLPIAPHRYVVVYLGAGIWPLRHRTCSTTALAAHIAQLHATIDSVFGAARLRPLGGGT